MDGQDTRTGRAGLAYNIIIFLATLAIGALLFVALNGPFSDVLAAYGTHTSTQAAQTGGDHVQQAWNWSPLLVVFLGMVQLLAGALAESKRP